MKKLQAGANTQLNTNIPLNVIVQWSFEKKSGFDVDASAFILVAGKVRSDDDFIFYNQPKSTDNTVYLSGTIGSQIFTIETQNLSEEVERIVFALTIHGNTNFSSCAALSLSIDEQLQFSIDTAGRNEKALILGELYLRNKQWKFKAIGQGFNGGLEPLATYYGVSIEKDNNVNSSQTTHNAINLQTKRKLFMHPALLLAQAIPVGKKMIEVHLPTFKKASQIAFDFIAEGKSFKEKLEEGKGKIKFTKKLDIVDNGLSIPASFSENQFQTITQKISSDLNIIKGQNEIMFLSNSISYFIDSHLGRTGIDRGISYALQYDIFSVKNHLKKTRDLRFPGYLLHQCSSLADTIKELNIFYSSILNQGHVPDFSLEEVEEELLKVFGISKRKGDIGLYIPYNLRLPFIREHFKEKEQESTGFMNIKGTLGKIFKEGEGEFDIDEINDASHESLYLLSEELIANEELEYKICKMIGRLPEKKLFLESYEND